MFIATFKKMQSSGWVSLGFIISSGLINLFQVYLLRFINNDGVLPEFWNWLYLTNARTIYTFSTGFAIMPIILGTDALWPITSFLGNSFWYPFSRLSYGAYLCHSIFMLFREFNSEKGTWGSEFDAILFYLAYLSFAFVFSLIITLVVETPCLRLYREFARQSANTNIKEAAALATDRSEQDENAEELDPTD